MKDEIYNSCDNCESKGTLEFIEMEWTKYMLSDSEELVEVYVCQKCGTRYTKREGNFELEMSVL